MERAKKKRAVSLMITIMMILALVPNLNVMKASAAGFTADDAIRIAEGQLGYHGKSSNANVYDFSSSNNCTSENQTPYNKYALEITGSAYGDYCVYFVNWCLINAGAGSDQYTTLGYYSGMKQWAKNRGIWHDASGYTPKKGDVIFYNWGHVGLVSEDSVNGHVYTIEGNTGSGSESAMVKRCDASPGTYRGDRIEGYASIDYNREPLIIPWEKLNLGDSFRAQILHDNGWFIKDSNNNIICVTGKSSDLNSWWEFTRNSNGSYRIRNCYTGRYIDDYGAGSAKGNSIVSWEGNGSAAQNWILRKTPNGKVLFEVECAQAMTMDMGGDPITDGEDVHLWVWSDDNTNQWYTLNYDKELPVIKNVKVSEVTKNGYKVECDVSDNIGIDKVEMPTWTTYNGQDDLAKNWPKATVTNGHATFYVSAADHNNETGTYITHIYAFDYAGQRSAVSAGEVKVSACDPHAWDNGKVTKEATCTENGEKTYTCATCGEKKTEVIKALGHEFDEGTVTKEATRFENGVRTFTCVHGCGETRTEEIPSNSVKWAEKISFSEKELSLAPGKTATIQVKLSPEDAASTELIWTSSNEEVATVDGNGKVKAIGIGEAVIKAAAADSIKPTTEYRYRTVVSYETKTTRTKGSLGEGWEYVSEKKDTTYGPWGDWSDWSRTEYKKSDTRDVESRFVPEYKTQYNYSKYAQYSGGGGWSGPYAGYWSGIYCGNYVERGWSDSPLSAYSSDGSIVLFGRSGDTWYNQSTRQVQNGGHYEYRFRDRTKTEVITYTYRRPVWSDWSSWSATPVEEADEKEIETRQVEGAGEAMITAECKVTVMREKRAGWYKDESGHIFYYNARGEKQTGWIRIGTCWYYVDVDTGRVTGAKKIDGKYYYFNSKGVMQTGWLTKSGKTYYFKADGVMATGWTKIDGTYYRFTGKGVMQTGWTMYKGNWYYLKDDGKMAKSCSITLGPKTYEFNKSGVCTNP